MKIFTSLLFIALSFTNLHAYGGFLRDVIAEGHDADGESDAPGIIHLPDETRVLRDIAYGEHGRQRFDVYLPAKHDGHAPVIVMVHGGAWRGGDKTSPAVVQNKINRWLVRGAIFISVNYRLLPETDPATQAEDVARALAQVQTQAAQWGGDAGKLILMGHSAGAHLVNVISSAPERYAMLGVKHWLGTVSLDTATINLVETMRARHYRFYDKAMGDDENYWLNNSPNHLLSTGAPPLLLVCSKRRADHPCTSAHAYAERARKMRARVEVSMQDL